MCLEGETRRRRLDRRLAKSFATQIPSALYPLIRAYLLGYATAVGPRLLTLLLQFLTSKKPKDGSTEDINKNFVQSLPRVLRRALDWRGFPAFCAILVGGSTLLEACSTFREAQCCPHSILYPFKLMGGLGPLPAFPKPRSLQVVHTKSDQVKLFETEVMQAVH